MKRYQMHLQMHFNEDREQREKKAAKEAVKVKRRKAEEVFLRELHVARRARKESEQKRADAERLVMLQVLAASVTAAASLWPPAAAARPE